MASDKAKMKRVLFIVVSVLILTSCYFGDNPMEQNRITGCFWLDWFDNPIDQKIVYSPTEDLNGGSIVVEKTVFAIGSNDNFIIAKQHPDKAQEVEERLYDGHARNAREDFEIKNLSDTIFLSKYDSLYQENGRWYHTGRDFTSLPDSLKLYRRITYFHIIETKKYDGTKPYILHTFDNESDFNKKRIELNIPNDLTFTNIRKEFE